MNRDEHVAEALPVVGPRIVILVLGGHAGRCPTAPDVEAAQGHDTIDPAATAQHGGRGRPGPRLWIEDFVRSRLEGRQAVAETPADNVNAAVDRRTGNVVALGG